MSKRMLMACLLAGALMAPLAGAAYAQSAAPAAKASSYKAPRLGNGLPDLSGVWTSSTLTSLERPAQYGDRLVMTPEEAARIEGATLAKYAERNAPTKPGTELKDLPCDPGNCGYNQGWVDPGESIMRVGGQPRTSFITSTPNGRMPPMLPAAQARAPQQRRISNEAAEGAPEGDSFASQASGYPGQNDNPETRSLGERCITSFGNLWGPVMLPSLYNNTYQIVQSGDSVAILVEMVHDVRVVRIGAKHRTDGVRPYFGDSIGGYEGDALVVETTGYHPSQAFRGASEALKVTERFKRVGPDRLLYQFTVEDPATWAQPWSGEYEFGTANGLFEYACHEGNYGLEGILAGARNDERLAAQAPAAPTGR